MPQYDGEAGGASSEFMRTDNKNEEEGLLNVTETKDVQPGSGNRNLFYRDMIVRCSLLTLFLFKIC